MAAFKQVLHIAGTIASAAQHLSIADCNVDAAICGKATLTDACTNPSRLVAKPTLLASNENISRAMLLARGAENNLGVNPSLLAQLSKSEEATPIETANTIRLSREKAAVRPVSAPFFTVRAIGMMLRVLFSGTG
jgi:hypothetical protein